MCGRGCAWQGVCVAGSMCGGRACVVGGVCGRGSAWQRCAWQGGCAWQGAATAADGMHPIEMHSCRHFWGTTQPTSNSSLFLMVLVEHGLTVIVMQHPLFIYIVLWMITNQESFHCK